MPVVSSLRCVCIERRSRLGHPLMTGTVFDVFIVGRICAEAIIAHTFEVSNERATATPFSFAAVSSSLCFFTSLVLRSCEVVLCNEFTMVGAELSYPHSCRRLPPAEGEHCWMKKKKKSITWWLFNRVMYTGEEICARMKGPPGVCCCCCCRASLGARPPRLMRADRRNLSICYLILFFSGVDFTAALEDREIRNLRAPRYRHHHHDDEALQVSLPCS